MNFDSFCRLYRVTPTERLKVLCYLIAIRNYRLIRRARGEG